MATHTKVLLRKWARYDKCDGCGVFAGDPCRRKIPAKWNYRGNAEILGNPHRGRPKSNERCGDTGGRELRIGSTFACFLVPDHGGETHRDWHGIEWPTQTSEVAA